MKLAYVPPVGGHETVYSLLARAAELNYQPDLYRGTVPERFAPRPVWPVGLSGIAMAFPVVAKTDAETLLSEHTPVRIYNPFLSPARREALTRACMSATAGEPRKVSGGVADNPARLRRCRACPPHWSVLHQLIGVVVCPVHGEILMETDVETSRVYGRRRLVTAAEATIIRPCVSKLTGSHLAFAKDFADSMASLIATRQPEPGPERLRAWFRHRLRERFAAPFGKIRMRTAVKEFAAWMGIHVPAELGLRIPRADINSSWLAKLLQSRKDMMSPIEATVVATFLEVEIETALKAAMEFSPEVPRTTPMRRGISRAHVRIERSRSELPRLWRDERLGITQIAARMQVSDLTVRRWAVRLDLPFPRVSPCGKTVRAPTPRPVLKPFTERVREARAKWILLLKTKPATSGVTKHASTQTIYGWLYRYDHRWLRAHLPKIARKSRVDWRVRDRVLSARVRPIVQEILARRPIVRASVSRIVDQLRFPGLFSRRRLLLPITVREIQKRVESHGSYVRRRLHHLAETGMLSQRQWSQAVKKDRALRLLRIGHAQK